MSSIQEFMVVEPPTSAEVSDHIFDSLKASRGLLSLVLLSNQRIPRPEPEAVDFRIKKTVHEDDHLLFIGLTAEGDSIRVRTNADPTQPATAQMVIYDKPSMIPGLQPVVEL